MKQVYYSDEDGNELKFHINSFEQLYISAGVPDEHYNGYVCLSKEDVASLIKDLKAILKEM